MTEQLVQAVLNAGGSAARARLLREQLRGDAGLLDSVLATAERWIDRDPTSAEVVAEATELIEDTPPSVAARAGYIRGRAAVMKGDHQRALTLLVAARRDLHTAGLELEALRAEHAVMRIQAEQGDATSALERGERLLALLDDLGPEHDPASVAGLRGRVHLAMGAVTGLQGHYTDALDHYASAHEHLVTAGEPVTAAMATHNRGVELLALGYVDDGRASLSDAAWQFADAQQEYRSAQSLIDLSRAELLAGRVMTALALLDEAAATLASLGAATDVALAHIAKGEIHRLLNLRPEALHAYQQAADALEAGAPNVHLATALLGTGGTLAAMGRHEEALEVVAAAATAYREAGNDSMHAVATLAEAEVLRDRGERAAARRRAEDALLALEPASWPVEHFGARLLCAGLSETTADAAAHVEAAERLGVHRWSPHLRAELRYAQGRLARRRGEHARAAALLGQAIDEIERLRGLLTHGELRASFLADKLGAYHELIALLLDIGDEISLQRAFRVADGAKSRALLESTTSEIDKRLHASAGDDATRRLAELRADLTAVYNQLLGGWGADTRGGGATKPLHIHARQRAVELEAALADHARPTGVPAPVHAFDGQLAEPEMTGAVVLAWHALDDELIAFVSRDEQLQVVRCVADLSTVRTMTRRLAAQWQRWNLGRGFVDRHGQQLNATVTRLLQRLGMMLFDPLRPAIGQLGASAGDRLVIVPHGPLHAVPFHALDVGDGPLLERWQIVMAPSVEVARRSARRRPATGPPVIVAVGDPDLPAVRREAAAAAAAMPDARLHTGASATIAAVRAVDRPRVLHLACHGLFRADNPMWSALRLVDGWLTAREASDLRLAGTTVVLSACESGRQTSLDGAGEAAGLARGFLAAGAARVIVSLWLTEDAAAARLMSRWYELTADGMGAAAALRHAQLQLRRRVEHPYLWAPFVLLGRP